ncbi:MAG: radical SAM protein [Planctomycetaceae bacterium]|nr:radical SAM protein [Planctomycetaceae bacterium]
MTEPVIKPRVAAFEVTGRCILNCRHCRAAALSDGSDPLDTAACKNILDGLAVYTACILIFTGGEPMLRTDILELITYSRDRGLRPVMATCGWRIDAQSAAALKHAGLLSFSFSVDGQDALTHDTFRQVDGAFEMTMNAIDSARRCGIRFQINTTLTKNNIDQMDAIARLAAEQGAGCWNPFVLVPVGRAKEISELLFSPQEYETVLRRLAALKQTLPIELRLTCGPQFVRVLRSTKERPAQTVSGCLAATEFAFISRTGSVQTCGFLNRSAGNLLENDFDFGRIWENSELLCSLRRHELYKGACRTCTHLQTCRGCRARAEAVYGDCLEQDPICILTRKQIP